MEEARLSKQETAASVDVNADPKELEFWGPGPPRGRQHDLAPLQAFPETLMTVQEVCDILHIPKNTWSKWRGRNVAPPVIRMPNGSHRVMASDLIRWIEDLRETDVA